MIIGEKNVGKTSLVNRYTEDKFSNEVDSTIGAYFSSKVIEFNVKSCEEIEEVSPTDNLLILKEKGYERVRIKL